MNLIDAYLFDVMMCSSIGVSHIILDEVHERQVLTIGFASSIVMICIYPNARWTWTS